MLFNSSLKGTVKLYFKHYWFVVIILLNTDLYKSAVSTYSYGKREFPFSVFSLDLCLSRFWNFGTIFIRLSNIFINHSLSAICDFVLNLHYALTICKNIKFLYKNSWLRVKTCL